MNIMWQKWCADKNVHLQIYWKQIVFFFSNESSKFNFFQNFTNYGVMFYVYTLTGLGVMSYVYCDRVGCHTLCLFTKTRCSVMSYVCILWQCWVSWPVSILWQGWVSCPVPVYSDRVRCRCPVSVHCDSVGCHALCLYTVTVWDIMSYIYIAVTGWSVMSYVCIVW